MEEGMGRGDKGSKSIIGHPALSLKSCSFTLLRGMGSLSPGQLPRWKSTLHTETNIITGSVAPPPS